VICRTSGHRGRGAGARRVPRRDVTPLCKDPFSTWILTSSVDQGSDA